MKKPTLITGFLLLYAFLSTGIINPEVLKAQLVNIPYYNDFEGSQTPFTDSTISGSSWEFGMPAYGLTTGTHSGQNAWDIQLNTPYSDLTETYLTTPFFNLGGNSNVVLSFWQNRNSEAGYDGTRIDYSTDGINWFVLGTWADTNATNWYSTSFINSSVLPAWEGASNGWIQSTYNLGVLGVTGDIRFRFVFTSDPSVFMDGFSLDDFSIYQLPDIDAGVSAIPNFPFLVAGTTTAPFTLTVKNYGTLPFNSFSASYKINNNTPVTIASTFNLLPGQVVNMSFPGFVVPTGTFSFCAYTTLAGDTMHFNDTLCNSIQGVATAGLPYTTDFEGPTSDWVPFDNGYGTSWELGTPNYGVTTGANSGIKCWDVNLNTAYTPNATCYLYSPLFDFTGIYNATLNFYQNLSTISSDGVCIQYSLDGGVSWNMLGTYLDPSGFNWYNGFIFGLNNTPGWAGNAFSWQGCSYPLFAVDNQASVIFRWVFNSVSTADGYSLDDVSITIPSAVDAGAVSVLLPSQTQAGAMVDSVPVTVQNFGSQALSSVTVSYTINSGSPVAATFPVNIIPNNALQLTLPGFIAPTGSYSVCCYTDMVADGNHYNDTLCFTSFGIPLVSLPFADNFDSGTSVWGTETWSNPTDRWQLGTPSNGIPNAPHSAPDCWDINLNATYNGPSYCILYSPYFDFTNAIHPLLSFWSNRNTEASWDGMRVECNIGNNNWFTLGWYGDFNGTNWYNTQILSSSGLPGWAGASTGWEYSSYNLDALAIANGSVVQFRFVFTADAQVFADGVAIDDFAVSTVQATDASVVGVQSPTNNVAAGSAVPVEITIKNKGLQTLSSVDVYYDVNGSLSGPFTWTGSLLLDSTTTFSMPPCIPIPGTNIIKVYTSWVADLNHFNDTLQSSFYGIYTVNVPYTNDFETSSIGWDVYASGFANTKWEIGNPAFGTTTGTHSGDSCWDVNLNSECGNLANTILYTPVFNFTNATDSRLSCWINYDTEPFADGFYIQYTTNGSNWQDLGVVNDPNGFNWYNALLPGNQPGWTLSSQGWKNVKYNTSFLDGLSYVWMRFKFTSDFAISSVGASMDDFSIADYTGIGETPSNGFGVYPSPASGYLMLEFPGKQEAATIIVYDVPGKEIINVPVNLNNKNSYKLNVTSLSPGVYFVCITTKNGRMMKMFVKS